jgi:hypothetical protein
VVKVPFRVEIQPPFGFTISSTKTALIKKYGLTLTNRRIADVPVPIIEPRTVRPPG